MAHPDHVIMGRTIAKETGRRPKTRTIVHDADGFVPMPTKSRQWLRLSLSNVSAVSYGSPTASGLASSIASTSTTSTASASASTTTTPSSSSTAIASDALHAHPMLLAACFVVPFYY